MIVTGICLAVTAAGIAGYPLVTTCLSNYSSVADSTQVPSAMIAGMWAALKSCIHAMHDYLKVYVCSKK